MRQRRVSARQAHPVPQARAKPRGPFPPELYYSQPVVTDYEPDEEQFADGATAQNNYRPETLMRCRLCLCEVYESETSRHVCPDTNEAPDMTTDGVVLRDNIVVVLNPPPEPTEKEEKEE